MSSVLNCSMPGGLDQFVRGDAVVVQLDVEHTAALDPDARLQ